MSKRSAPSTDSDSASKRVKPNEEVTVLKEKDLQDILNAARNPTKKIGMIPNLYARMVSSYHHNGRTFYSTMAVNPEKTISEIRKESYTSDQSKEYMFSHIVSEGSFNIPVKDQHKDDKYLKGGAALPSVVSEGSSLPMFSRDGELNIPSPMQYCILKNVHYINSIPMEERKEIYKPKSQVDKKEASKYNPEHWFLSVGSVEIINYTDGASPFDVMLDFAMKDNANAIMPGFNSLDYDDAKMMTIASESAFDGVKWKYPDIKKVRYVSSVRVHSAVVKRVSARNAEKKKTPELLAKDLEELRKLLVTGRFKEESVSEGKGTVEVAPGLDMSVILDIKLDKDAPSLEMSNYCKVMLKPYLFTADTKSIGIANPVTFSAFLYDPNIIDRTYPVPPFVMMMRHITEKEKLDYIKKMGSPNIPIDPLADFSIETVRDKIKAAEHDQRAMNALLKDGYKERTPDDRHAEKSVTNIKDSENYDINFRVRMASVMFNMTAWVLKHAKELPYNIAIEAIIKAYTKKGSDGLAEYSDEEIAKIIAGGQEECDVWISSPYHSINDIHTVTGQKLYFLSEYEGELAKFIQPTEYILLEYSTGSMSRKPVWRTKSDAARYVGATYLKRRVIQPFRFYFFANSNDTFKMSDIIPDYNKDKRNIIQYIAREGIAIRNMNYSVGVWAIRQTPDEAEILEEEIFTKNVEKQPEVSTEKQPEVDTEKPGSDDDKGMSDKEEHQSPGALSSEDEFDS